MSRSSPRDSVTPFIDTSLQQPNEEARSLSDILRELKIFIEQHEYSPLENLQSSDAQIQQPSGRDAIIEKIEKFILFNRFWSCSFRFKSTHHGGLEIFQIAKQQDTSYVNVVTTVSAMLFFLTDAGVTVVTTKNSVAMLKNFLTEMKAIIHSLRDEAGELPLGRMICLFLLLPGGMWGAFNKGFVGTKSIFEWTTSCITHHPPQWLFTVFRVLAGMVGSSSALCFFVFNMRNGLGLLRTFHALLASECWGQYFSIDRKRICRDQIITFVISVAMTLITLLATFYAKGSFEITWRVALEALFIGLSNLMLNTFFTTGPNYILKTIKAHCNEMTTQQAEITVSGCYCMSTMGLKIVGVISSLGNSFAVLPAIFFILTLASKEPDLAKQSILGLVIAFSAWIILAVPMFTRDFAYYTKPLLEWLEKKQSHNVVSDANAVTSVPISQSVQTQQNSQSLFSFRNVAALDAREIHVSLA